MRLDHAFIRLPLHVDVAAIERELQNVAPGAWRAHPEAAPGNTALPLVAREGDPNDDAVTAPMAATPHLEQLPGVRAVMATLDTPIGRSRLMRIAAGGGLDRHVDTNRHWQDHLRIHVPLVTDPRVRFVCDDETVHMAAGEVWVFDTWRRHGVDNPGGVDRIHLVIDTVGSAPLWQMIEQGGPTRSIDVTAAPETDELTYERNGSPALASPWQQESLGEGLIEDLGRSAAEAHRKDAAKAALLRFLRTWRAAWFASPGLRRDAEPFRSISADLLDRLSGLGIVLDNGIDLTAAADQILVAPTLAAIAEPAANARHRAATPDAQAGRRASRLRGASQRRIERPVFIVSPPRSGSTMLFEALSRAAEVYTIGGESHGVIESIPELHPAASGWASNRLGSDHATAGVVHRLDERFAAQAMDRDGRAPRGFDPFRLLEKTPKNALRVPFLAAAFPDARFVYLHRRPEPAMASIIEAWRSGRFVTYRDLPGWPGAWSLLLPPGWERLKGLDFEDVAAHQWAATTELLLDDLDALPADRWCAVDHDELVEDPDGTCRRLASFLGCTWDQPIVAPLPLSATTLDAPAEDKWRRHEAAIERVRPRFAATEDRAFAVLERTTERTSTPGISPSDHDGDGVDPSGVVAGHARAAGSVSGKVQPAATTSPRQSDASSFASSHSTSFPALLAAAGASLAITTYQAGRVVLCRVTEDGRLNTHLRAFARPMGLAVGADRLALGTGTEIIEFRDQPTLARRLPDQGEHDACFVPRAVHVTGDIAVHELAFAADGDLWVVNTRFSCLATVDGDHSFVPRWRPPFVTALAAEDRCHLNGLAMVDGRPRYVTALGVTDEPAGWRPGKVGGGVIIDIDDNAIVASGLTMPHSPRWYRDELWVLDSGQGQLCRVDLERGSVEPIVRLPGFARGLALIGGVAFVGLSQVREHVFAGLPLADHVTEREAGVWAVDLSDGTILGILRFDGDIDEVFDVQVLPNLRYPDLLEPADKLIADSFVLPDEALADVR